MAMIKCSECGKEISDRAERCPNCGCPIQHGIPNNMTGQPAPFPPNQNMQNVPRRDPFENDKNSGLGIAALILSILGCTFWLAIVLAIIDLCKRNGRKKTFSIIALVISCIWLIIGVTNIGKNDNSDNKTQETTIEESTQKIQEETIAEGPEQTEKEIEETKDKFNVGDTWDNKYVLVSYDECGEYVSDNQFIQPADGNKYVYATFTFENVGSSDTTVGYWDFDCYADGYACEAIYGADGAGFTQTLSSGRKISGSVYFEVPEDATEIEFEYSPNFWTSEKIVFVYG